MASCETELSRLDPRRWWVRRRGWQSVLKEGSDMRLEQIRDDDTADEYLHQVRERCPRQCEHGSHDADYFDHERGQPSPVLAPQQSSGQQQLKRSDKDRDDSEEPRV